MVWAIQICKLVSFSYVIISTTEASRDDLFRTGAKIKSAENA